MRKKYPKRNREGPINQNEAMREKKKGKKTKERKKEKIKEKERKTQWRKEKLAKK